MADTSSKSEGRKSARKHSGLGRGLGALIPQAGEQSSQASPSSPSRPLDVFFPEGSSAGSRGGSAKDLLQPKRAASSSKKKRPTMPSVDAAGGRRGSSSRNGLGGGINGSDSRKGGARVPVAPEKAPAGDSVSRETSVDHELLPVPGASFAEVAIDQIVPNTKQPREVFDEDDLKELSASIKEVGVLQPVVVRTIPTQGRSKKLEEFLGDKPEARYELIMGERRLRASQLAGETTIPAIIRETEDGDLLRDALLENLHRAQLNPLEEASAYQQLMADFGATQEELAKRIARSRPQIANTLRLLKLPPSVQKKVAAQVITAGHARALLSLSTPEEMERLAERIVAEGLSVRTTEEIVRLGKAKAATPRPRARQQRPLSTLGESVVSALSDAYDTRVTITEGRKKGRIVIEFAGSDDLQRIADLILR
ncbi:ParB/RepB/Spo0J family partition protein [Schaalia odontolytica]|uniref:Probable chromosome-partitioning protein parB n=1 Tax=Schaalia odontolytica TaxID=1660 RepID=A0A2X0TZD4_9ACTO|nr:ParB/RepB/Spo0J family partition protein [Schaalia odontolytica]WMS28367.1 ParB/RepB/Spo0J family partition protein [Schaalia odontolytica]SPT55223.1 Probable chromosome-partitioning protein parB [Schaalia odontolytica]